MKTYIPLVVRHNFSIVDPQSWLSAIIRLFTWSIVNHSAEKVIENTSIYVIEARASGVVKVTWEEWLNHRPNKEWWEGKTYRLIREDIVEKSIGLKYDILSLFQQAIYSLTRIWIGPKNEAQVNCSELMAWYYNLPKPWLWTAKDLFKSKDFIWIKYKK